MMVGRLLCVWITAWALYAQPAAPSSEGQMTFLDNGEVRIGMDLNLGGAVTFVSSKDHPRNIINSADLGRQIQMSHYSGPWPFVVGDKKPSPAWAGLGWNPIQTGDCYRNPSEVVEHRNNGREIYIKCTPMQWPHNNVPGDCTFETWTTLNGPLIHMRFRCTNRRADQTAYRPCPQELPAVYTISKLWRLMSYTGDKPFTAGALTHIRNDWRKPWPWTRFIGTERWAALVNDEDWGFGVFKDDGGEFHGGIHGDGRSDDPKHGSTAYVAPIHVENFDHNIVYEHQTDFMLGHLEEIRRTFNRMASKVPPRWRFDKDRQHWTLRAGADQGFPLKGEWRIQSKSGIARIEGPVYCWGAEQAPFVSLEIQATPNVQVKVFWKRLDADSYQEDRTIKLVPSESKRFRVYQLRLADSPEYKGLITGLAIASQTPDRQEHEIAIKQVKFAAAPD